MRFVAVCTAFLGLLLSSVVLAGFELRPGAVVDEAGSKLYVMEPGGGMTSVDLSTGATLWTSPDAARPLYADDEIVVAQVEKPGRDGALLIAMFDAQDLDRNPALATLQMPQGAKATVTSSIKRSFQVHAVREGGSILVRWTARKLPGPTGMDTADPKASGLEWSGAARIPLGRGGVREIDPDEVRDPRRPQLPGFDKSNPPRGQARMNSETAALVELDRRDPRRAARVRRWNMQSGRELAPLTVFGDGNQVKNLSSDGKHLLGSRRGMSQRGLPSYTWSVIDLDRGARVAKFQRPLAAGPFAVLAGRVLIEALPEVQVTEGQTENLPLRIIAIDSTSGRQVWTREIRDTEYRGTLPPAR